MEEKAERNCKSKEKKEDIERPACTKNNNEACPEKNSAIEGETAKEASETLSLMDECVSLYKGKGNVQFLKMRDEKVTVGKGFFENMKADCEIIVPDKYKKHLFISEEECVIDQIAKIATFPGVISPVIGLPDIHAGVVFPVGVCALFDAENPECVVLPEAIGSDVNCGVRVWKTNIKYKEFMEHRQQMMELVKSAVPVDENTEAEDLSIARILEEGLEYLVSLDILKKEDLERTENNGRVRISRSKAVGQSPRAKGEKHLGTLGSGNHYLEFQLVSEIYQEEAARRLGLEKDDICVSVHTGSRGLGFRAVTEFIKKIKERYPVGEVVSVPLNSKMGQEYLEVVGAASNFAFCNRAIIGKRIQKELQKVFPHAKMEIISDSPHNIAKIEDIDGKPRLVVRKGSTRVGSRGGEKSPVSVGGSMSTGSYLICAGENASSTNNTTCHGSGRIVRRKDAKEEISVEETLRQIDVAGALVHANNLQSLPEESEQAYKSIDEVAECCENQKISEKICRLLPLLVIKG